MREVHDVVTKETLIAMDADLARSFLYVDEKKRWFDLQMEQFKVPIQNGVYKLKIRRDHLVEDSISQF